MLCNGVRIEAWAFNPNNVLSWEDSAGHTAWLLFMALPGGPHILGNVITPEQSAPSSEAFSCPINPGSFATHDAELQIVLKFAQ